MKEPSRTSDLGDQAEADLTNGAGPAVVGAARDSQSPGRAAAQAGRGGDDRAQQTNIDVSRAARDGIYEQLQRTLSPSSN